MATELQAFLESWDQEDLLLLALLYRRRKYKKYRSVWIHPILKTREKYGEFHRVVSELWLYGSQFKDYFRLTTTQFEHVLTLVGPLISKEDTRFRKAITPAERLTICLRYIYTQRYNTSMTKLQSRQCMGWNIHEGDKALYMYSESIKG